MIRGQLFPSWRTRRRNVSASRRRDRGDENETLQVLHIVIFTIFEL
jgi:hypothetical protein